MTFTSIKHRRIALACAALAASAMAATAAWAAVASGSGQTRDQAQACQRAKNNAADIVRMYNGEITSYSRCDCSYHAPSDLWSCTVDAYYKRPE